ncbi:MAG: LamG-like jellyroll fold domain-containing protein, partial [Phycisphaeraceae bacterium]
LGNGAQNGVYNGTASIISGGIVGKGVDVTPANPLGGDVTVAGVLVTNNISVEAWIKADTATWTANGWGPNARGANGFLIHPDLGNNTWRGFIVNNAGVFTQIGQVAAPIINDQYHHYAITFDDATDTGRMYFDGVLVATNAGMALTRDANAAITVVTGRDTAGATVDRRGDGQFDEVAIFNASLAGDRVKAHYMAGKGFTSFASASDLDLQGKFAYALNIGQGGSGSAGTVMGLEFTGDGVAGATVQAESTIFPAWGPKPEYGPDASNNALENIMHSIRFDSNANAALPGILVDLAVDVGANYKLQLLFSENGFTAPNNRTFDIEIEGAIIVNDGEVLAATGGWSGNPTIGGVFTYEFIATDSVLNIRLLNGGSLGNRDPILNALTLENTTPTPEPASLALLGMSAFALLRRRSHAAA